MAKPHEKLAQSLTELKKHQTDNEVTVVRSRDFSRTHLERLVSAGYLKMVLNGWYIQSRPSERVGDTTPWYTSFWSFCAQYLDGRYEKDWCLTPDQSLTLHAGDWTVPSQLIARSPKANNSDTALLHDTSIFSMKLTIPDSNELDVLGGMRVYSIPAALIASGVPFFTRNPTEARTILSLIRDSSEILGLLLEGDHTVIGGRLAGAFRNIKNHRIADEIIEVMRKAGFDVRESDPFEHQPAYEVSLRETSPYVQRIKIMWQNMRDTVINRFPSSPGMPEDINKYLVEVEDTYKTDAYHSLSIEGYQVTVDLIEKVRKGNWDTELNEEDKRETNALAARGYYQAFQKVKAGIERILNTENSGEVVNKNHQEWYRELFMPSVDAGIIEVKDLAGYRRSPVYIRGSMHVPMNRDAVLDSMPALFELLENESEPCVRSVLGHFIFVFIHPYVDGNGRMGRFLINTMLASGGYPWTVIPMERREQYMVALEKASTKQGIEDFVDLIAELVQKSIDGEPEAKL